MKRFLLASAVLLLLLVAMLLAGLVLMPGPLEQAWTGMGLSTGAWQRLVDAVPAELKAMAVPAPGPATAENIIEASGILEAKTTRIMAEVGGQVAEIVADQGDAVQAGQVLVRLDDRLVQAQLQEAEQAVATARANLEAAQAGPRQGTVAEARAALRQATATWTGARLALDDARRALSNPLALDARLHAAQAAVSLAERQIEIARAQQAALAVLRESVAGDGSDQGKTQHAVYLKQEAAAAEAIAAAEADAAGARRVLSLLQQMRNRPIELEVRVRAAEALLAVTQETVQVAQKALELAESGPRTEAVALAEAQLRQATAARDLLHIQVDKRSLASPLNGTLISRAIDAGETAAPGATLATVADLSRLTLVVYVPASKIGLVSVGQAATLQVDAFPGQGFPGTVTFISPRAEFTPSNVLTEDERASTVFAVKISLDNPDGRLKPGMPADALLVSPFSNPRRGSE